MLNNFLGNQLQTNIAIITLNDNLVHTYLSKITWQDDNSVPLGTAEVVIPYSKQVDKYWSSYSGCVVIHAELFRPSIEQNQMATIAQLPTKKIIKSKEQEKIKIQNDEYNYSFIGKVYRAKQIGQSITLYIEDLGWKFLQKVPDDFRKKYIAGQTLDNAFQAICEFMGIEFAYSIDEMQKYNFSNDGYSVEKNGVIIEETHSILEDYNDEEKKMAKGLTDITNEETGLMEYDKKNNNNNSNITNSVDNLEQENNPKKQQYGKEFDEKIKDLFKGNTLYDSNISDAVLNYNYISVSPDIQNQIQQEADNNERISSNASSNN